MDEFRKRLNRWALAALVLLSLLYVVRPYIPAVAWGEVSFYSWMGSTTTNLINLLTAYLWVIIVIEVLSFTKSTTGRRTVGQLRPYGVDKLYRTVCGRCLHLFRFRIGLESFGSFPERIGLPCLYRHTNRN